MRTRAQSQSPLAPNFRTSGGGSDGNSTGALGIPTLDGPGVRGAYAHTLDEHIDVDSLAERGRFFDGGTFGDAKVTRSHRRRGSAASFRDASLDRERRKRQLTISCCGCRPLLSGLRGPGPPSDPVLCIFARWKSHYGTRTNLGMPAPLRQCRATAPLGSDLSHFNRTIRPPI